MDVYEYNRNNINNQIQSQKLIQKFRSLIYLLNKDIRQRCFEISKNFLINEKLNPELSISERESLTLLINHWNWNEFENQSTLWWSALSINHSKSITFMNLIHLWVDDINLIDSDVFETSTLGIR